MDRFRKLARRYRAGVWAIAVIALVLQAIPLHFHLNHVGDQHVAGSAHVAGFHIPGEAVHHDHPQSQHVIDLNLQGFFKQLDSDVLPMLTGCLLALLLLPVARVFRVRTVTCQLPPPSFFALLPPLRAPPRI